MGVRSYIPRSIPRLPLVPAGTLLPLRSAEAMMLLRPARPLLPLLPLRSSGPLLPLRPARPLPRVSQVTGPKTNGTRHPAHVTNKAGPRGPGARLC